MEKVKGSEYFPNALYITLPVHESGGHVGVTLSPFKINSNVNPVSGLVMNSRFLASFSLLGSLIPIQEQRMIPVDYVCSVCVWQL